MRQLLFRIKPQSGVAYKNLRIRKECNFVLYSSKHEEITFHHEFTFVLTPYILGALLSKKTLSKVGVMQKNI